MKENARTDKNVADFSGFYIVCRCSGDNRGYGFDRMNEAVALLLDYTDFGRFGKAHSDNKTNSAI